MSVEGAGLGGFGAGAVRFAGVSLAGRRRRAGGHLRGSTAAANRGRRRIGGCDLGIWRRTEARWEHKAKGFGEGLVSLAVGGGGSSCYCGREGSGFSQSKTIFLLLIFIFLF